MSSKLARATIDRTKGRTPSRTIATPPQKHGRRKPRGKPKQPGKPKKKTSRQRQEAQQRAAELSAIGWIEDKQKRRIADASYQRKFVSADLLANEGALQQTKWIEYRYMTPLQCTERFAHEYIAAYRRVYARHFDARVGPSKQPISANLGQNTVGEINSLWVARQDADRRGIPYDIYLDTLMEGKVACDKWRQPPLPCQLLCKLTGPRLRMRPTREEVTARLFQPHWDRRFYASRVVDDPVQAAAMRELRIDVLRASDRPRRLAKYLGVRGLLSEASARSLFEGDGSLVDEALLLGAPIPRVQPVVPSDYLPPCIGNRHVAPQSPCQSCPVTTDCMRMKGAVMRALTKTTGSGDPRLAHKRQVDRERQQRWRANKKDRMAGRAKAGA